MVTSTDAKQAIYRERMEQLRSWMRHYRFGLALRRRTRRFFKEYYASHSAIDDNAILADLAPDLQRDVADYLLHASIKHHPLFAAFALQCEKQPAARGLRHRRDSPSLHL